MVRAGLNAALPVIAAIAAARSTSSAAEIFCDTMPIASTPVDTLLPASNDSRAKRIVFATSERMALKQALRFRRLARLVRACGR
jgi:hypothetical protein